MQRTPGGAVCSFWLVTRARPRPRLGGSTHAAMPPLTLHRGKGGTQRGIVRAEGGWRGANQYGGTATRWPRDDRLGLGAPVAARGASGWTGAGRVAEPPERRSVRPSSRALVKAGARVLEPRSAMAMRRAAAAWRVAAGNDGCGGGSGRCGGRDGCWWGWDFRGCLSCRSGRDGRGDRDRRGGRACRGGGDCRVGRGWLSHRRWRFLRWLRCRIIRHVDRRRGLSGRGCLRWHLAERRAQPLPHLGKQRVGIGARQLRREPFRQLPRQREQEHAQHLRIALPGRRVEEFVSFGAEAGECLGREWIAVAAIDRRSTGRSGLGRPGAKPPREPAATGGLGRRNRGRGTWPPRGTRRGTRRLGRGRCQGILPAGSCAAGCRGGRVAQAAGQGDAAAENAAENAAEAADEAHSTLWVGLGRKTGRGERLGHQCGIYLLCSHLSRKICHGAIDLPGFAAAMPPPPSCCRQGPLAMARHPCQGRSRMVPSNRCAFSDPLTGPVSGLCS